MYRYSLVAQGQVSSFSCVQIGPILEIPRRRGLSVIIRDRQRIRSLAGGIPVPVIYNWRGLWMFYHVGLREKGEKKRSPSLPWVCLRKRWTGLGMFLDQEYWICPSCKRL
ncbi:hypothetical protein CEXT_655101 [Caerostris extrusa]|uniref:Uncharacterized protein n=1 Tax=Caerostris extrusa TaxID=172846 RepID=A0AAV4VRA5_CAEEX|nr:hypothetical protein CEXT_655101 [Caerostris extrusa]